MRETIIEKFPFDNPKKPKEEAFLFLLTINRNGHICRDDD
jgi:hypothetical protein